MISMVGDCPSGTEPKFTGAAVNDWTLVPVTHWYVNSTGTVAVKVTAIPTELSLALKIPCWELENTTVKSMDFCGLSETGSCGALALATENPVPVTVSRSRLAAAWRYW